MFRPLLEKKLKDIFGLPAVRYGSINERSEKNVVWVEIFLLKHRRGTETFIFGCLDVLG